MDCLRYRREGNYDKQKVAEQATLLGGPEATYGPEATT
jgi:hypothetical protein